MTKPKDIKVALLKPHTHNGQQYKQGETIPVSAVDAAWLAKQKIITPLKAEQQHG